MCLDADRKNPLKGKMSLKFDKKGYVICWKVYHFFKKSLRPPNYYDKGSVTNGWIVSDRKSKKIGLEYGDTCYRKKIGVNQGIHVYTSKEKAVRSWRRYDDYVIVPVRCHKSQLVAVDMFVPEAVFMKVFLKKADYEKVVK